jgi:ribulose-phosphate 3-epimerase
MKIIPAILEKNLQDFEKQVGYFSKYFSQVQIDISDGLYTPQKTIDILEINDIESDFSHIIFDFHLMVKNPSIEIAKIKNLKNIKTNIVLIHIDQMENLEINEPVNIGTVLNPEHQVSDYFETINEYPYVQIMTVHPGFQGQIFLEKNLSKIEELKELGFNGQILLDGGINDASLPLIAKNDIKPDFLCIGSYLKTNTEEKIPLLLEM